MAKLRDQFSKRIRAQLFGPISGEHEEWEKFDHPHKRYTVGILYPRNEESTGVSLDVTDEQGVAFGDTKEPDDSPLASFLQRAPSSAGITFAVSNKTELEINLYAGKYDLNDEKDKYTRKSLVAVGVHYTASKQDVDTFKCSTLDDYAELHVFSRTIGKIKLITLAVINKKIIGEEEIIRSEDCLFQVKMNVKCLKGKFVEPPAPNSAWGIEEKELRLRYRKKITWATGHATSANWKFGKSKDVPEEIEIDYLPESEVHQFVADSKNAKFIEVLSIDYLSKCVDSKKLRKQLYGFVDEFKAWVENIQETGGVPGHEEAYQSVLSNLVEQQDRLYRGIDVLCNPRHPERIEAFKIANLAMLDQMERSEDLKDKHNAFMRADAAWRPFQLAFQLLSIPGIINDDEDSGRDLVDLIWFPTGGGKTEAYLLLAAFTIIWRRLCFGQRGCGTTVISRYTLRLLTSQQFERTTLLTCALERLRRDGIIPEEDEINIGLWIGGSESPNKIEDAQFKYEEMLKDEYPSSKAFLLLKCPWCGKGLTPSRQSSDPSDYGVRATSSGLKFNCVDRGCDFHDGLPVQVVDECLYSKPPSILLGTIDKFARVPWMHESKYFFGINTNFRPPDLIIQDELHLISGPLGTIAAIYEAGVDILCREAGVPAKVVASTATIRGAREQVLRLYGREVRVFPAPGPNYDDSFYMTLDTSKSRKYVGIMGQGKTPITSNVQVSAALLDAANHVTDTDLFWTLVSFHNSKRELGKTLTLCRDDIPERMKIISTVAVDGGQERLIKSDSVVELSSKPNISIPEILNHMEMSRDSGNAIDVLACTNMLSVGVDVSRLNLMLIQGQPKTVSEYIQASSRVGRSEDSEGVVVTLFSPTKPRDRSHYESFAMFHQSLYRWVEPTSVTPHSLPALDRALHAVVIMLIRLKLIPSETKPSEIGEIPREGLDALLDALKARIGEAVDADQKAIVNREIDKILEWWDESAMEFRSKLHYKQRMQDPGLMRDFGSKQRYRGKETLHSMRNVDGVAVTFVMDQQQLTDEVMANGQ